MSNNFTLPQNLRYCKLCVKNSTNFLRKGGETMYIYSKYITKNGRRIYRPNNKPFRFWIDDDKVK